MRRVQQFRRRTIAGFQVIGYAYRESSMQSGGAVLFLRPLWCMCLYKGRPSHTHATHSRLPHSTTPPFPSKTLLDLRRPGRLQAATGPPRIPARPPWPRHAEGGILSKGIPFLFVDCHRIGIIASALSNSFLREQTLEPIVYGQSKSFNSLRQPTQPLHFSGCVSAAS